MRSTFPTPDELRGFVERGWGEAREATERYFAEDARTRGPRAGVEISDMLWADMRAIDPTWPDGEQRRADLAHHLELCAKLARLADAADRSR